MVKPTGLLQPVISDEQIMAYAKLTAQNVCADSAMHAISPSLVLVLDVMATATVGGRRRLVITRSWLIV